MSALPAIRAFDRALPALTFGSSTQIAVDDGRIAAFLAFVQRQRNVARYALRLLNETPHAGTARLTCIARDGTTVPNFERTFDVAPFSVGEHLVPIHARDAANFDRVVVEMQAQRASFIVEAPAPPRAGFPWRTCVSLAFCCTVAAAGSAAAFSPRIDALLAPERALAGSALDIPFLTSGTGDVDYTVNDRNGLPLGAGIITANSGTIHVTLPKDPAAAPFVLRVTKHTLFAQTERVARIDAAIPAPSRPHEAPLLGSISVNPPFVEAGKTLTVSYAAYTRTGTVYLVDNGGRTWAKAPLAHAGETSFVVPLQASGRAMRAVVHAQAGKRDAEQSAQFLVTPASATVDPQTVAEPTAAPPAAPSVTLSSDRVAGGETVTVRVANANGDARVVLTDARGTTVASGDASDGAIAIAAPSVSTASTYYVVTTLNSGTTEQTVVRKLIVEPH